MVNPELWKTLDVTAGPLEPGKPVPDEYTLVVGGLDKLFLQTLERATPFTAQERPSSVVSIGSGGLGTGYLARFTYMLMENIPIMQYEMSSSRVVTLFETHDIRLAMLMLRIESGSRRVSTGIRVTSETISFSWSLVPILVQVDVKKTRSIGARSSCRVQPRVSQVLFENSKQHAEFRQL